MVGQTAKAEGETIAWGVWFNYRGLPLGRGFGEHETTVDCLVNEVFGAVALFGVEGLEDECEDTLTMKNGKTSATAKNIGFIVIFDADPWICAALLPMRLRMANGSSF